jgi:hypothetical protein
LNLTSNTFEIIIFVLLEYKCQLFILSVLLQLFFSIIHHVINM